MKKLTFYGIAAACLFVLSSASHALVFTKTTPQNPITLNPAITDNGDFDGEAERGKIHSVSVTASDVAAGECSALIEVEGECSLVGANNNRKTQAATCLPGESLSLAGDIKIERDADEQVRCLVTLTIQANDATGSKEYTWKEDWAITENTDPFDQEITVIQGAPSAAIVGIEYLLKAKASSGLAVNITATGDCTVSNNYLYATGAGTCTVIYSQAGDSRYEEAEDIEEVITTVVAEVVDQTITLSPTPPTGARFGEELTLAATASSGLPVEINVSGYCALVPEAAEGYALASAGVKLTGIGACTVIYKQPGGDNNGVFYSAATPISRTITVARWTQSIDILTVIAGTFRAGTVLEVEAVANPPYDPSEAQDSERNVTITVAEDTGCIIQSSQPNWAAIFMKEDGIECVIYFNQVGNRLYSPAPQLTKTIIISQVTDGYDVGSYWTSNKLLTTGAVGKPQPIMSPPMVARNGEVRARDPNVMVVFGTGIYHQPDDLSNKEINSVYGVHDRGEYGLTRYNKQTGSNLTMLEERTFSEATVGGRLNRKISGQDLNWSEQYGWYVDLLGNNNTALGERSVFRPFLANKLFVFNTVIPVVGTCSGATQGWTMLIDWASGKAPNFPTYDANGDGVIGEGDEGYVGYFNEIAGSELGRGGDSIYDTSGEEARRTEVSFGVAEDGSRIGWEEKAPYGVLKR